MSSLPRTINGFLKLGPGRFFRQLNNIGDTKVGTLIGTDKFGNKYFENLNESYGTADNLQLASHPSLWFSVEPMLLSYCFLFRQCTSGYYSMTAQEPESSPRRKQVQEDITLREQDRQKCSEGRNI